MRRRTSRKYKRSARIVESKQPAPQYADLAVSNPEWLRESLFNSLSSLSYDERSNALDRILSDLRKARVNLGPTLFKLGIPASKPDELSPNDMAKLVRFIRINQPEAMKVIASTITELTSPRDRKAECAKSVGKAA